MTKDLGKYLKRARDYHGFSLREVERLSGREISDAQIQKLEKGEIESPSPEILRTLAKVYDVQFLELMWLAGYITRQEMRKGVSAC